MPENRPNNPTPKNLLRWFDPRSRQLGTFAFILNRVTAIGLTFYLFLHLTVLGQLARGQAAYDGFIALAKSPVFMVGEYIVVVAGFLHGLNGLRIAITSFTIGVPYQKQLFISCMTIALVGCILFAIRMFGGG
jgi:succinate dehydrogenase / fumarate reductase, cytochrome b subunit